ncbi:type I restriction endonuclease subunit R [Apibacter sp. HY039]|uniref:type I restriction endonuclease subunit R n=1 Tax=Apibacter sp. HY039 TaxID=2501476 RepID=UPI001C87316E|nr:type I restriction endonuclease subunit R [Apibacter sp. HY039]
MSIRNYITEDEIEKAAIEVLTHPDIKYRHINCFKSDTTGRETEKDVVIKPRLRDMLKKLNPDLPEDVRQTALNKLLTIDRLTSDFQRNREMMKDLRKGIEVKISVPDGRTESQYVKVIDWENPLANDFLVVSQLWIQGEVYRLRPDLILFINGLPLVFIELKNSNINIEQGYKDNLTRYKEAIPDLFVYNAFLIVSNGSKTRIGSTFASWEYFFPWLRVTDEKQHIDKERIEAYRRSLDYAIRGLLKPDKLIDYIDNFIFFYDDALKICAKNHQFLGVNHAIERFRYLREQAQTGTLSDEHGKLGVFWHTQGSGKSFSMVMLTRKIISQFTGNYTFLIVTDRDDLDEQIYKNYQRSGIVGEKDECRPKSSSALRKMLGTNAKCIFTLIQKFRYDKGKQYPILSERNDIIVFIDEAHRTQYKDLAENMRAGLPNAQFMAFTGTPLFGSKKLTNDWFGENVSEYNFQQAVEDEATVPLFYRKCLPQMQLANETLNEDFYEIIEDENISEQDSVRLEKEYGNELQVLRNPDRLNEIAQYIAYHFPRRGYLGKGMVVAIDKFTAVRLHDLVKHHWQEELRRLNKEIASAPEDKKKKLKEMREWMRETEMRVVISEEAGEEEKFAKEGLDIKPHRALMKNVNDEGQDLEDIFKIPESKFRLVFICSMWLTGFDVPTASTLYLDKPMKDHTLMQAIARVNRITDFQINGKKKANGLIIDHCNVFGRLKKAMSTYGGNVASELQFKEGSGATDEVVKEASVLFDLLKDSINECCNWCKNHGIDLPAILEKDEVFSKVEDFHKYADTIIGIKNSREHFKVYDNAISSLYDACRPEILKYRKDYALAEVIHYLRKVIDNNSENDDIDRAKHRIKNLLNESVVATTDLVKEGAVAEPVASYGIKAYKEIDLSKLDINKLKEEFKQSEYKNIEIDDLRNFLQSKLDKMLQQNSTRSDFATRLQNIIDKYNAGSQENEEFFEELLKYKESLSNEEQRAAREGLTEEELEIFDLLKKDNLTKDETQKVKLAAKELLVKLKKNQGIIFIDNWYDDTQLRSKASNLVKDTLHEYLPISYDHNTFPIKTDLVFNLILTKSVQGNIILSA